MAKVGQKVLPKQDKGNATKWHFRPLASGRGTSGKPVFYFWKYI